MKTKLSIPQLTAWLLVATSAPILSMASEIGWVTVVLGGILSAVVSGFVLMKDTSIPKWVSAFEAICIILYLGAIARESATCWQTGIDTKLLPLILLIVSVFAASKGLERGGRCGASVLWFVAPGVFLILLAGVNDLQIPSPKMGESTGLWISAPLFLLPLLSRRAVQAERGKLYRSSIVISSALTAVTMWQNAVFSPANVKSEFNAFYDYSKGVTLFGVAERFEAVSACLLTVGWFSLFVYLLGVTYEILEKNRKGAGRWGIWAVAAIIVLLMYNLTIPMATVGVLSLISWGILPLMTQILERLKKSEKSRKTA